MSDSNGKPGTPRVALVTNVLAHYRVPCFRELARALPGTFDLFLLAGDMPHRHYVLAGETSDLEVTVLPGRSWHRPPEDDVHWNDIRPLFRRRYDVVVLGGWSEPTYLLLWFSQFFRRGRLLFWVESTVADYVRSGPKEWLKRFLLWPAAGCWVPGQGAGEYCRRLGMPEELIFELPNATDRPYFVERAERHRARRDELRAELGLERITFLFVGRLVEAKKAVSTLLRAAALLDCRDLRSTVLLAGEGPDRGAYEAQVADEGPSDARFLGNLDHEKLCQYYAAADALVLPSHSEPWGFVLNEAMEFSLPLVVSDAVGARPDLVQDNGLVFPAGDVDALASCLEALIRDPERRLEMGRASKRRIEDYSPEAWAQGALEAIRAVITRN